MIEYAGYKVAAPDTLETPAMLVFDQQLSHNLRTLCDLAGGGQNLMVHVKTHKSAPVVRRQLEAGVAGFKCATLKELEMVLECGATRAILAYPQTQALKVERLADLVSRFSEADIYACVSAREHVEQLAQVAVARSMALKVLLDLDVGMHRTGVAMGDPALELYRSIAAQEGLEACGLHVYDGHEHIVDPRVREATTQGHIQDVQDFRAQLDQQGLATPMVVGGGSFTFAPYAHTEGMLGSPGSGVYWDWRYGQQMPDMPFQWAALILSQVIDRYPEQHTLTTELGCKAICGDPPLAERAHLIGFPEAELQLQNEEHGVFRWSGEMPPVGAYLLAVPGHVCPTTIRYPGSYLLDAEGEVIDFYPHTARDRQ